MWLSFSVSHSAIIPATADQVPKLPGKLSGARDKLLRVVEKMFKAIDKIFIARIKMFIATNKKFITMNIIFRAMNKMFRAIENLFRAINKLCRAVEKFPSYYELHLWFVPALKSVAEIVKYLVVRGGESLFMLNEARQGYQRLGKRQRVIA